jgi:hypothetical protein
MIKRHNIVYVWWVCLEIRTKYFSSMQVTDIPIQGLKKYCNEGDAAVFITWLINKNAINKTLLIV